MTNEELDERIAELLSLIGKQTVELVELRDRLPDLQGVLDDSLRQLVAAENELAKIQDQLKGKI